MKHLARLRAITLIAGLLLATACTAQSSAKAPYTEGNQYVTLPAPHQRYSADGKVEVVEVFSYGCIHCHDFVPIAEKLKQELPKGVVFKLMPAVFSNEWVPYARAYYAAKQLGVAERTHAALFKAKFDQHYPLNSLDDLADFYARQGVNRAEFMRIANSPAATDKLKADFALAQKWGVQGTPSLVVDGKYLVTTEVSQQQVADVALWLAKRELAGAGTAGK